jgi:methionyl-tRNA synthetase
VIKAISDLLAPFLPETSEKIEIAITDKKSQILFPKILD